MDETKNDMCRMDNCTNKAGGYRSPFFCEPCDRKRIDHLGNQLDRMMAQLEREAAEAKGGAS